MSQVTVSLLSLVPSITPLDFFNQLDKAEITPLIKARVVQWIILPFSSPDLLAQNWDILLVLPSNTILPESLSTLIAHTFSIKIQQPAEFLASLPTSSPTNPSSTAPTHQNLSHPLISTHSQPVALTPSLLAFSRSDLCPKGAVSMLNFIAFQPTEAAKRSYATYIEKVQTSESQGTNPVVKMLGEVDEEEEEERWDEVVLAGYEDLGGFCDMCADGEYQDLNRKYRLPALRDTGILMTTEVELGWEVEGSRKLR